MSPALAHRVATSLLVLDGTAALSLGGLLGPPGVAIVSAAVAASWWRDWLLGSVALSPALAHAVVVLAAIVSAADLLYLAQSTLDGLVRLLLFLLLYRLVLGRSLRDARDVGFLAFFMLVAAAPVAFGVGYLFVFLAFVVLGTWTLMLHHVLTESSRAAGTPGHATEPHGLGRGLLGLSLAASAATLVVTGALFFVIPRVGQAALPLRASLGRMVSGFSERVELGAFGEIEADATIVMRAYVPDDTPAPEHLPGLRWRGIAFERFDGHAWTSRRPQHLTVRRSPAGRFDVNRFRGTGPLVTQEIYLEPLGTEMLFVAPRALRLALRADAIAVDETGSVSVPVASARLRYVVQSELEGPAWRRGLVAAVASSDTADLARYLQLPPVSARLRALARQVTAGSRDPNEAAERLTGFLSGGGFRYTRVLERGTALDPLDEFLFVRRSGNCEYFASALAVMLRTLGIPARVVNGFQRGEWNPYGRYFMVRLRDAHSWVEASVGDRWLTFDPSPRGDAEPGAGMPKTVSLYLDALRLRWYRYVISWSLADQVMAALTIRRSAARWTPGPMALAGGWRDLPRPALLAVASVLAGLVLVRWRRGSRARRSACAIPPFYADALRALARRGLRPGPEETAREFLDRVGRARPACAGPLAGITTAYERVRFGSAVLDRDALADLERCVVALRALGTPRERGS